MSNSIKNAMSATAVFSFTALAALAVNVAPAAAQSHPSQNRYDANGYNALAQYGSLPDGFNGIGGTVTRSGEVIGADPDVNIRFQIMRDQDSLEGGSQ